MSELEKTLATQMHYAGLATPEREYRFHLPRKWKFDFAYPLIKLAIECEGGTWTNGRHTRGVGFAKDCEKYNQAALDGWRVLRFTREQIFRGEALKTIIEAIEADLKNGQG